MQHHALPLDTTLEAARMQIAVFRRMSGEQRLQMALQMNESLRKVVAAGVRNRHPELNDDEVRLAVIRLTLGERLFRTLYPNANVPV